MKVYELTEVEEQVYPFLTVTVDGYGWSASRPGWEAPPVPIETKAGRAPAL
jgi:hypothetical protein